MRNGWPIKTLDDLINDGVVELGRGKVISKKDLLNFPGAYPVYSSAKNNEGKFGEYGHFMFDEELITWSIDGGGRLFHRPKHRFSITNVGGYIRIKNPDLICYRFLYFCLSLLQSRVTFDWVKKAHPSVIRKLYREIPLPPLPEQQRIAAILDEAFAGIDTAIANTEKNLVNARELFESYLNSVFSQRGDGWAVATLDQICVIARGGSPRPIKAYLTDGPDGVNWIKIADATASSKFIYKTKQKIRPDGVKRSRMVHAGDLLLSNSMSFGRPYIMKTSGCIHDGWLVLTNKTNSYETNYLYYFLGSSEAYRQFDLRASGSTVRNLNIDLVRSVQVPIPPLPEQARISAKIGELEAESQRIESIYQQKLTALSELKQSLLQKAFAGELTANKAGSRPTLKEEEVA